MFFETNLGGGGGVEPNEYTKTVTISGSSPITVDFSDLTEKVYGITSISYGSGAITSNQVLTRVDDTKFNFRFQFSGSTYKSNITIGFVGK